MRRHQRHCRQCRRPRRDGWIRTAISGSAARGSRSKRAGMGRGLIARGDDEASRRRVVEDSPRGHRRGSPAAGSGGDHWAAAGAVPVPAAPWIPTGGGTSGAPREPQTPRGGGVLRLGEAPSHGGTTRPQGNYSPRTGPWRPFGRKFSPEIARWYLDSAKLVRISTVLRRPPGRLSRRCVGNRDLGWPQPASPPLTTIFLLPVQPSFPPSPSLSVPLPLPLPFSPSSPLLAKGSGAGPVRTGVTCGRPNSSAATSTRAP
jgi:hypothetical protein